MGRLLRKKKVVKKKSPTDDNGGTLPSSENEGEGKKALPISSEKKRQPTFQPQKKNPVVAKKKDGPIEKGIQFLREARAELKKVTWPTRQQTLGSTAVVIVLVIIISVFLGVVDMGLSGLIRLVLQ